MGDKSNKDELIKIVVLGIIIVILVVVSIIINKSKINPSENENNIKNANDFPIENIDSDRIEVIDDINGIYYYELEDYGDSQDD